MSENHSSIYDWSYALKGAANIVSVPAIVLLSMFIGYGGVAREAGMSLAQTAFSVPTIWALPSNLILVAGVASGASIVTIALSVGLASLRMMPMTIALMPEIRTDQTRKWHLYGASCFVAVTAWVHTLSIAPSLPKNARLPYFIGFALTLMIGATIISMLTWQIAGKLPAALLAGLYFLTPIYFAISIWRTARIFAEHLALILGFILGPLFALVAPGGNILLAGIFGGVVAYAFHRWKSGSAVA